MSQLYFAFGSNMSPLTLRDRGVDANPAGAALLEDHRLAFTLPSQRWTGRAADVRPAPGSGVWGVLWEMADPDALDLFELRYNRSQVNVVQFPTGPVGLTKRAFTYMVKPEHRAADEAPPAPECLRRMVDGCRAARALHQFLRNCRPGEHN